MHYDGSTRVRIHRRRLPPLAWLFDHQHDRPAEAWLGPDVDEVATGFFEGCYAADWASESFDRAEDVFGSGMTRRDGQPWFIPPSHTLESLYVYRHDHGYGVSNSLAFLVAHFALTVPYRPDYGAIFATVVHGIDDYEPLLMRVGRGEILRVVFDNFTIDDDGRVRTERKPSRAPVSDFASYREALRSTLEASFANAADPRRRTRYTPLTTCSSGYDSATGAALAKSLGCQEAVTLRSARGGAIDSGVEVGRALGLKTTEVERTARAEMGDDLLQLLATGMGGEDVCFRQFLPMASGKVLLTGFHGGRIWDPHSTPNRVLSRRDRSGNSLQEVRLQTGFLHIPVPLIAARQHPTITAISMAPEMAPYSIGGSYDRPISRRILEEAGVPRPLFGQSKKAGSTLVFWDPSLLPPDVTQALTQLRHDVAGGPAGTVGYWWHATVWQWRQFFYRAFGKVPLLRHVRTRVFGDWRVFEGGHPRNALAFMLGLSGVRRRYTEAMTHRP